jgi:hypothetical protein
MIKIVNIFHIYIFKNTNTYACAVGVVVTYNPSKVALRVKNGAIKILLLILLVIKYLF